MRTLTRNPALWLLLCLPSAAMGSWSFSLPTVSPACGAFSVTLSVTAAPAGTVYAFDFDLEFDATIVTPTSVQTTEITQGCDVVWNVVHPEIPVPPSLLKIAVPCVDGIGPATGGFLTIHFDAVGHGSTGLDFARCEVEEVACTAETNGQIDLFACPTPTPVPTPTPLPGPPCTCNGDADKNGFVNFSDFSAVRSNFGAPPNPVTGAGDADCNNFVNFADFTAVRAAFGQPCPPP